MTSLHFKNQRRSAPIIFFILFFAFIGMLFSNEKKQSQTSNVLFLNSYHHGNIWSDTIFSTVEKKLHQFNPDIELQIEYMDTQHHPAAEHMEILYRYYSQKYKTIHFDLIIASDDNALTFLMKYHDKLFGDIPVVFCGVNDINIDLIKKYKDFTGVFEEAEIESTVQLITKLHPNTRSLYLIYGARPTSQYALKWEGALMRKYFDKSVIYFDGKKLSTMELLSEIMALPEDAVLIYGDWQRDKNYELINSFEMVSEISDISPVPFYALYTGPMGYGVIGGHLAGPTGQGQGAAKLAIEILQGKSPSDLPLSKYAGGQYIFDYRQLKRFNIPISQIPKESTILYRPVTFYMRHKHVLRFTSIVFIMQSTLIIFLVINIMQRRRIQEALQYEKRLLNSLMDNIPDQIYFKDVHSRFIRNNRAHLTELGVKRQESALGKTDHDFFPKELADSCLKDEKTIFRTGKPLIDKLQKVLLDNNSIKWLSATKVPVRDEEGHIRTLVGVNRDITNRIEAENRVKASLREKEVLLQEIHHRVKNNLQVISSLLNLQASKVKDAELLGILTESKNRIRSMALIHESLYQSKDLGSVHLVSYIKDLVDGLISASVKSNHKVEIKYHIEDIHLNVNYAVPCGLILNELITNSLKHGLDLKDKKPFVIQIHAQYKPKKHKIVLKIFDNGVGFPPDFQFAAVDTLGLRLVKVLAEDQLNGSVKISSQNGAMIQISFVLENESEVDA